MVAVLQYLDTAVLTAFVGPTITPAATKLNYITARSIASKPHDTHHRSTRPVINCPSRPNRRHKDVPLIKERGASPETASCDAVFLRRQFINYRSATLR